MNNFYRYLRNYKLNGVLIYLKLKLGFTNNISVPRISHPMYLRKATSDVPTFFQIFGSLDYSIPLKFKPKSIIDLGANVGFASIYFANKYPDSKIISIEPETSNFEVLKKNTAKYKNIHLQQNAISNIDDKYIEIINEGFGHWAYTTRILEENTTTKSSVKTTTVKKIMEMHELTNIDILKIDIEGGEKELFESDFESWIPITKCIIVELHDNMKKGCSKSFFKAIANYNFSFKMKGENLILINDDL